MFKLGKTRRKIKSRELNIFSELYESSGLGVEDFRASESFLKLRNERELIVFNLFQFEKKETYLESLLNISQECFHSLQKTNLNSARWATNIKLLSQLYFEVNLYFKDLTNFLLTKT